MSGVAELLQSCCSNKHGSVYCNVQLETAGPAEAAEDSLHCLGFYIVCQCV